jgi:hypothetical protein
MDENHFPGSGVHLADDVGLQLALEDGVDDAIAVGRTPVVVVTWDQFYKTPFWTLDFRTNFYPQILDQFPSSYYGQISWVLVYFKAT